MDQEEILEPEHILLHHFKKNQTDFFDRNQARRDSQGNMDNQKILPTAHSSSKAANRQCNLIGLPLN